MWFLRRAELALVGLTLLVADRAMIGLGWIAQQLACVDKVLS